MDGIPQAPGWDTSKCCGFVIQMPAGMPQVWWIRGQNPVFGISQALWRRGQDTGWDTSKVLPLRGQAAGWDILSFVASC